MKKIYLWLLTCLLASSLIAQDFEEIKETSFEGVKNSSVAFADIDNDNDQDVLITGLNNSNQRITKLYANDGNENFTEVLITPFEGVEVSSIAFADVDNDNDQDVLITGYNGQEPIAKLYANDGNGNFNEVSETPFEGVCYSSIAFADIDNDDDQDVLITGGTIIYPMFHSISKLYTNDGNGFFTEVLDTPFEGVYGSSIAFADIDNDNDQDVLITGVHNWDIPISKLYTNDGNGFFTEVLNTPFEVVYGSSIAFADVDNDNDQDVLIVGKGDGDFTSPISKLYTNDGDGVFSKVLNTHFKGLYNGSIAFADIDNDNDQDVLVTGQTDDAVWYPFYTILYANDGNANFTEVLDTPFDQVSASSIAFNDVDNDNDQDVLITGQSKTGVYISKLYRNLTIVGIYENALFSSFSIYPNPNTGQINIDLGSLNNVSIKVLNVSGQLIYYKENINSPIYQFELNAAPGIYILELSAEGEKQQFKLIKQ